MRSGDFLSSVIENDKAKSKAWFPVINDCSGVTAIEYGLIAGLIAIAAVVIMGTVGTSLSSVFNTINTDM